MGGRYFAASAVTGAPQRLWCRSFGGHCRSGLD
jgi:hypothetical protein